MDFLRVIIASADCSAMSSRHSAASTRSCCCCVGGDCPAPPPRGGLSLIPLIRLRRLLWWLLFFVLEVVVAPFKGVVGSRIVSTMVLATLRWQLLTEEDTDCAIEALEEDRISCSLRGGSFVPLVPVLVRWCGVNGGRDKGKLFGLVESRKRRAPSLLFPSTWGHSSVLNAPINADLSFSFCGCWLLL